MATSQLTNILLLVAVGLVIYYMTQSVENLEDVSPEVAAPAAEEMVMPVEEENALEQAPEPVVAEDVAMPAPQVSSDVSGMGGDEGAASLDSAFMGAVPPNTAVDQVDFNRNNVTEYDSAQYLPKEINDEWFDTDFTKAKYNLNDDKMINTNRYMIGVNTVGQSLKNPSYDIRGTIANPKYTVSPWNNSTYEPDNNLKPLC